MSNVLSQEQIEEFRAVMPMQGVTLQGDLVVPYQHRASEALLDSHEALRAELARLQGQTCATCKWWIQDVDDDVTSGPPWKALPYGECSRQLSKPSPIRQGRGNCIKTHETFRCSEWAARDTDRPSGEGQ